jgi:hypothetical protein
MMSWKQGMEWWLAFWGNLVPRMSSKISLFQENSDELNKKWYGSLNCWVSIGLFITALVTMWCVLCCWQGLSKRKTREIIQTRIFYSGNGADVRWVEEAPTTSAMILLGDELRIWKKVRTQDEIYISNSHFKHETNTKMLFCDKRRRPMRHGTKAQTDQGREDNASVQDMVWRRRG